MAGFSLEGYTQRIPCPHCESTDCCGIRWKEGLEKIPQNARLMCCTTGKIVSARQLEKQAQKHSIV